MYTLADQLEFGTEVWLDIDRSSTTLDSVIELIDSSGQVQARTDNSLDEAMDPNLLFHNNRMRSLHSLIVLVARDHRAVMFKDEVIDAARQAVLVCHGNNNAIIYAICPVHQCPRS